MSYPVADGAAWQRMGRPSTGGWAKSAFHHAKRSRPFRSREDPKLSRRTGSFAPLTAADLPLVCIARNAANYVRSFLRYYRTLGVTRFIMVDDHSEDGTGSILEAAPDVDLYSSPLHYKDARRGQLWREAFFDLYGRGRWYLSLDADEFLVYPGSEARPLGSFIGDLEAAGLSRCHAPMLDLYPAGRLADGVFDDDGTRWPFEASPEFDGDGYTITEELYGYAVRGGPRRRLFGNEMRQSKFPLLFVDDATDYRRGSIHGPAPVTRNFVPVTAVLLHYRFSANSIDEFRKIVEVGGHAEGGRFYREILDTDRFSGDFSLAYDGSLRFAGSEDLVDRGFMMDLRRNQAKNRTEHR